MNYLLQKGASPNIKGPTGLSGLQTASNKCLPSQPQPAPDPCLSLKTYILQWKPNCDPHRLSTCSVAFSDWFRYKYYRITTDADRELSLNGNGDVSELWDGTDGNNANIELDAFLLGNILTSAVRNKKWEDAHLILSLYYSGQVPYSSVDHTVKTRVTALHLVAWRAEARTTIAEPVLRLVDKLLELGASRERLYTGSDWMTPGSSATSANKNATAIATVMGNEALAKYIREWGVKESVPLSTGVIVGAVFGGLFVVIVGLQCFLNR